jgi:hypothetical protein
MALAAGVAQAEVGSNWMVSGANITSLLPEVQVKEVENNTISLLFTTKGGTKVEILCTQMLWLGAKLHSAGKVDLFKMLFHGCITKLNGAVSGACQPSDGTSKGLILTLGLEGLIILHNGTGLLRITPEDGVFTHILLGEECAIGEELLESGVLTLKDCQGRFSVEQVEHLFEQGPLTTMTTVGVPSSFDGSFILRLAGPHLGLPWSGLPA